MTNREQIYATRPFSALEAVSEPRRHPEPHWVLFEHETGRVIAYCPGAEDAERLKALLVYYGDKIPGTNSA